jgi:hypothetical protein
MDRRGLRAIGVLGLAVVPALVLLAPRAQVGGPASAAGASGDPHSSMAGPTTFAAIGPTAIPASPPWDDILAVPTPASSDAAATAAASAEPQPPAGGPSQAPRPRGTTDPGRADDPTAAPTLKPTPKPTPAPTGTPAPAPTAAPTPEPTPNPAPCAVFPDDNVWNKRVDDLPVRSDSVTLIGSIGLNSYLHPDFSSTAWNDGLGYGIPINKVDLSTPTHDVAFRWDDESDAGPYPIPANPKIEGGSDRHLILWDTEGCDLFELFNTRKSDGQWLADSGATWNLRSNTLRPDGWTSADAAGLPILPGLVRYDEVADGAIGHALRFTAPHTRSDHIYPARHDAGEGSSASLPPMGLRIRLKASVDISGFGPQARVILLALKRYGMILADNGSPWYVTGAPNANWDDDQLHDFHQLHGSDFEVVDTGGFRNG